MGNRVRRVAPRQLWTFALALVAACGQAFSGQQDEQTGVTGLTGGSAGTGGNDVEFWKGYFDNVALDIQ